MTPELFVQRIQSAVYQTTLVGTIEGLQHPPGRSPLRNLREDSEWYTALSETDQARVNSIVARTAHHAVLGFLCVLDQVRSIKELNEPEFDLQLRYIGSNESTLLNPQTGEFLHDVFNDLVPPT